MTYVAIAKSLFAWAHTIEERTAALVVLHGWAGAPGSARLRPGTGDLERSDSAMGAQDEFVLVAEKTDCNSMGLDQHQRQATKCHGLSKLKREAHQQDIDPSSKKTRRKEKQRQKEGAKEKRAVTLERIQIEATVHFDPEHLSREFLESKFGVLFRPNVANNTRRSLCKTK